MKKFITKSALTVLLTTGGITASTFTQSGVVYADTAVNVTIKIVPMRGTNIFGGREDYSAVKSKITLNGATSGNGGSMERGDTRYFTINTPAGGMVKPVTIEAIMSNGARVLKNKTVWIDGNRKNQTIYVTVD